MNCQQLMRAIDLALEGNWKNAHEIVQNYDDRYACWIHAVLHKIEGDENNSRYWYSRAGRPFASSLSDREELEMIKTALQNE
ncbi:MAG: hypothetical protein C4326_08635 [Ignavibacteria bacterium]